MPINLNVAISALDTSTSLLPFFIKDAFDVTGRTAMAHHEGGKHEAREKFIEEAGTSFFWICGIPIVRSLANRIVKGKIDTDIHFKRINSNGIQNYFASEVEEPGKNGTKVKKFSKKNLEGIELGGEKLTQIKTKLKNAKYIPNESKGLYSKFHVWTTGSAVLINLIVLSIALPKLNQLLSKKIISNEVKNNKDKKASLSFQANNKPNLDTFLDKIQSKKGQTKPSFGSLNKLFEIGKLFDFRSMAEISQLEPVNSMLLLDYGISGSRVTVIPRNNNERIENCVKEGGIIFFFYYASDMIKKGLARLAEKIKTPINLDYKVINSPEFKEKFNQHKNKNEILAFANLEGNEEKDEIKVIKMIDEELRNSTQKTPKERLFQNFTLQMAQKEGLIDVEYDASLGKWIRHSKKYIQTDKVIGLNKNLRTFYEHAFLNVNTVAAENVDKVIAKTKAVKIGSIFANMAICCACLSFIIPKIQYLIREHRTNTKSAPGIKHYQDMAENNMI